MKLSIISTSHQKNSQSKRVSEIFKNLILELDNKIECFNLDMFENKIPLWTSEKSIVLSFWDNDLDKISAHLKASDGFIFVVPEYGGMASPSAKNFFLIFNSGELFHSSLIVSISSGNGGAYPISELRSSSYKNTHVLWIPENIIIGTNQFLHGKHGDLMDGWMIE